MSADMNDMIAKLQLALSQQQNQGPSLYGLQAQQDPNVTAQILKRIQDQNYVDNQGNGDPNSLVGLIGNAGKKDFARLGQGIGNLLGVGQPPQYDNSQVQQQRQAITDGKGQLQQLLQVGTNPNDAQLQVLTKLAQAGVPGAADALDKAQQAMLRNQQMQASTQESLGKVENFKSEDAHRKFEESQAGYTPRPDLSNSEYYASQQGGPNGKIVFEKRGDKLPPPPLSAADDSALNTIAGHVAAGDLSIQDALSRVSGPQRNSFLNRVYAANPNYNSQDFKTAQAMLTAYGSGKQGQQTLKLQNAINHLDLLKNAGEALDGGDLQALNSIANTLGVKTGSTPQAAYAAIAPIVANEVSGAIIPGGGGEAERIDRVNALAQNLSQPQRVAAINGMRGVLAAQYANAGKQYEAFTKRKDFMDRYPIAGGLPAPDTGGKDNNNKVVDFGSLK